ncbi:hypothetical protein [Endozoicomonas elysicola]|uniref:Uncharacterized protein n=1 Tax=Endozoicomonas elysicola TaxID=305900 RepID=A0A081KB67_9GAMM|nr:hypothetical protein [Endozoicomonas elysicola]KEI71393.1 hypothetical protein GV64_12140 [Endozoicomonas elysicola]
MIPMGNFGNQPRWTVDDYQEATERGLESIHSSEVNSVVPSGSSDPHSLKCNADLQYALDKSDLAGFVEGSNLARPEDKVANWLGLEVTQVDHDVHNLKVTDYELERKHYQYLDRRNLIKLDEHLTIKNRMMVPADQTKKLDAENLKRMLSSLMRRISEASAQKSNKPEELSVVPVSCEAITDETLAHGTLSESSHWHAEAQCEVAAESSFKECIPEAASEIATHTTCLTSYDASTKERADTSSHEVVPCDASDDALFDFDGGQALRGLEREIQLKIGAYIGDLKWAENLDDVLSLPERPFSSGLVRSKLAEYARHQYLGPHPENLMHKNEAEKAGADFRDHLHYYLPRFDFRGGLRSLLSSDDLVSHTALRELIYGHYWEDHRLLDREEQRLENVAHEYRSFYSTITQLTPSFSEPERSLVNPDDYIKTIKEHIGMGYVYPFIRENSKLMTFAQALALDLRLRDEMPQSWLPDHLTMPFSQAKIVLVFNEYCGQMHNHSYGSLENQNEVDEALRQLSEVLNGLGDIAVHNRQDANFYNHIVAVICRAISYTVDMKDFPKYLAHLTSIYSNHVDRLVQEKMGTKVKKVSEDNSLAEVSEGEYASQCAGAIEYTKAEEPQQDQQALPSLITVTAEVHHVPDDLPDLVGEPQEGEALVDKKLESSDVEAEKCGDIPWADEVDRFESQPVVQMKRHATQTYMEDESSPEVKFEACILDTESVQSVTLEALPQKQRGNPERESSVIDTGHVLVSEPFPELVVVEGGNEAESVDESRTLSPEQVSQGLTRVWCAQFRLYIGQLMEDPEAMLPPLTRLRLMADSEPMEALSQEGMIDEIGQFGGSESNTVLMDTFARQLSIGKMSATDFVNRLRATNYLQYLLKNPCVDHTVLPVKALQVMCIAAEHSKTQAEKSKVAAIFQKLDLSCEPTNINAFVMLCDGLRDVLPERFIYDKAMSFYLETRKEYSISKVETYAISLHGLVSLLPNYDRDPHVSASKVSFLCDISSSKLKPECFEYRAFLSAMYHEDEANPEDLVTMTDRKEPVFGKNKKLEKCKVIEKGAKPLCEVVAKKRADEKSSVIGQACVLPVCSAKPQFRASMTAADFKRLEVITESRNHDWYEIPEMINNAVLTANDLASVGYTAHEALVVETQLDALIKSGREISTAEKLDRVTTLMRRCPADNQLLSRRIGEYISENKKEERAIKERIKYSLTQDFRTKVKGVWKTRVEEAVSYQQFGIRFVNKSPDEKFVDKVVNDVESDEEFSEMVDEMTNLKSGKLMLDQRKSALRDLMMDEGIEPPEDETFDGLLHFYRDKAPSFDGDWEASGAVMSKQGGSDSIALKMDVSLGKCQAKASYLAQKQADVVTRKTEQESHKFQQTVHKKFSSSAHHSLIEREVKERVDKGVGRKMDDWAKSMNDKVREKADRKVKDVEERIVKRAEAKVDIAQRDIGDCRKGYMQRVSANAVEQELNQLLSKHGIRSTYFTKLDTDKMRRDDKKMFSESEKERKYRADIKAAEDSWESSVSFLRSISDDTVSKATYSQRLNKQRSARALESVRDV